MTVLMPLAPLPTPMVIDTDGPVIPQTGQGGRAALLKYRERETMLTGIAVNATAMRREMEAVIQALHRLDTPQQHPDNSRVHTAAKRVAKRGVVA